jgi:hypothetical protein
MSTVATCPLGFDAAQHAYTLHGMPVPSVTQVLKASGYIRLDGIPAAVLEAARLRGQHVHELLHYLLEDDLDPASVDPAYAGYVASARAYLDRNVARVLRCEMRVFSLRHHCAGMLDLLAVHRDGYAFIGDFKTGDPADVAADLQLSAYLAFLLEMRRDDEELAALLATAGGPVIARRSIRLFGDGRPAIETPYTDSRDFQIFLNALNVVHDQRRRPAAPLAWDDER